MTSRAVAQSITRRLFARVVLDTRSVLSDVARGGSFLNDLALAAAGGPPAIAGQSMI